MPARRGSNPRSKPCDSLQRERVKEHTQRPRIRPPRTKDIGKSRRDRRDESAFSRDSKLPLANRAATAKRIREMSRILPAHFLHPTFAVRKLGAERRLIQQIGSKMMHRVRANRHQRMPRQIALIEFGEQIEI